MAKSKHRKILGETIRSRRKKARVSQERLAEKADLHHNYIGEIERGEKAATIDTLVKIAKALGVRPRDLLGGFVRGHVRERYVAWNHGTTTVGSQRRARIRLHSEASARQGDAPYHCGLSMRSKFF